MKLNALLSQPFGQFEKRKLCKGFACAYTPALERFHYFNGRRKHLDRQHAKARGFLARRDHGYAGKPARRMQRYFKIGRGRYLDDQTKIQSALREKVGNRLFRTK